jgi:spermidine synthase
LEETDQTFDVILIDLIDAYDTPSLELYQRALPLTKKALSKGGIVSSFGDLSGTPCSAAHNFRALSRQFDNVATHLAAVETFGGSYAFFLASNDVDFDVAYEREDEVESSIRSRARALKGGLRSLVPDAFPRCFRLPPYINERIETRLDASFREELAEHVEWIYPESTEDDRGAHEGVEGTR